MLTEQENKWQQDITSALIKAYSNQMQDIRINRLKVFEFGSETIDALAKKEIIVNNGEIFLSKQAMSHIARLTHDRLSLVECQNIVKFIKSSRFVFADKKDNSLIFLDDSIEAGKLVKIVVRANYYDKRLKERGNFVKTAFKIKKPSIKTILGQNILIFGNVSEF